MKSNAGIVLKALAAKIKKAQAGVPKILANVGQNYFLSNFQKEAWRDTVYKKWPKRKDKTIKRPVLIGRTRKLRQSVQRSIKEASPNRIRWGTSVPYAEVHNEGFRGIVHRRAHKRKTFSKTTVFNTGTMSIKTRRHTSKKIKVQSGKMNIKSTSYRMNIPQRRFMGQSKVLTALLTQKYKQILFAIK